MNPTPDAFLETCVKAGNRACEEGDTFARRHPTMADVWDSCPRADWLLWMMDRLHLAPARELRLFACWCAEHTPLPDGRTTGDLITDPRSREAIRIARLYADGQATRDEMLAAGTAAWEAAKAAAREAVLARAAAWAGALSAAAAAALSAEVAQLAARRAAEEAEWAAARAAARAAIQADDPGHLAAAEAAAWAAQANALRSLVPNPFR